MELLWGIRATSNRGPKPGLSIERIVEAAVEIADEEGFDALSMRGVAARLGTGAASLYTYLPDKEALLGLMLDAAVATELLPHERPGNWREKFEGWARADWQEFRTHPWALRLASIRPLIGPNLLAWLESALSVLADTGLNEFEMAAAVQSIDAYVRGHARLIAAEEGSPGDASGSAPSDWRTAQRQFLERHVDFREYPNCARVWAANGFADPDAAFEFGLARLLDGLEAFMARGAGTERTDPPGVRH